jgi:hypothetical protein
MKNTPACGRQASAAFLISLTITMFPVCCVDVALGRLGDFELNIGICLGFMFLDLGLESFE